MTVRLVRRLANWMAIEPTPPAPPTMRMALAAPDTGRRMSSRSNIASQAVSEDSGSAAAAAKSSDFGFRPTIRSSTRWNSELVPDRLMVPAYQTSSPGAKSRVSDPADRRRVRLQVTPAFYAAAEHIWGPMAADWRSMLSRQFTTHELNQITRFLQATNTLGRHHMDRLRETP